eukprot:GHRR01020462.1.p1 GENE.GHRR01020462.1~~GHRR01020462.1.p1  ORF type:complete len:173 (-),score=28.34 GHRR01020462.1:464-982(-)
MSSRAPFSSAAATRSLSFSCLFTAASVECEPGDNRISTLNRGGRLRSSLVRIHKPISVAMLQCSTVGVNITLSHRQEPHGHQRKQQWTKDEVCVNEQSGTTIACNTATFEGAVYNHTPENGGFQHFFMPLPVTFTACATIATGCWCYGTVGCSCHNSVDHANGQGQEHKLQT